MKEPEKVVRKSEAGIANELLKEVGLRLEFARMTLGHIQTEMADVIGVHKNTYGRWERGEREMGIEALYALREQGIDLNWLITGVGHIQGDQGDQPEFDLEALTDAYLTVDNMLKTKGFPMLSNRGKAELLVAIYKQKIAESLSGE